MLLLNKDSLWLCSLRCDFPPIFPTSSIIITCWVKFKSHQAKMPPLLAIVCLVCVRAVSRGALLPVTLPLHDNIYFVFSITNNNLIQSIWFACRFICLFNVAAAFEVFPLGIELLAALSAYFTVFARLKRLTFVTNFYLLPFTFSFSTQQCGHNSFFHTFHKRIATLNLFKLKSSNTLKCTSCISQTLSRALTISYNFPLS